MKKGKTLALAGLLAVGLGACAPKAASAADETGENLT